MCGSNSLSLGNLSTDSMKTLYKNISYLQLTQVVEHNGHKFRIQACHKNGSWLVWLSIMTKDGAYERIESNETLNFNFENLYFLDCTVVPDDKKEKMTNALEAVVPPFLEYIEQVY